MNDNDRIMNALSSPSGSSISSVSTYSRAEIGVGTKRSKNYKSKTTPSKFELRKQQDKAAKDQTLVKFRKNTVSSLDKIPCFENSKDGFDPVLLGEESKDETISSSLESHKYIQERVHLLKRLREVEHILNPHEIRGLVGNDDDNVSPRSNGDTDISSFDESITSLAPPSPQPPVSATTFLHHSNSTAAELERHSFKMDGLTSAEMIKEVNKAKSHHSRTMKEAAEKVVHLLRHQTLHEDEHEETFYELFYDLILAVVFIKLSYLKYDLTFQGALSVGALFANFWSCWSLLNVYVTMLDTEDVVHRLYYVAHITASFFMAISIQNPEFHFFNYRYMAWYHAGASVVCRTITLCMWAKAYSNDLVKHRHEESTSDYSAGDVRKQISVHFFTILASILIFIITMVVPWDFTHADGHHWPIAMLWLFAIGIEQLGSSGACVYMNLPFPAMYCGSRMQAWLMLCFGESVIALLIEPIFYDSAQVGSISAAFVMILCLCMSYFDIVDADQFLHLLVLRNEKWKAIMFMNFQLFFSFSVFLVGVSLKTIIYVSNTLYYYEVETGCGLGHHHEAAHRRLEYFDREGDLMTSWSAYNQGASLYGQGGSGFLHQVNNMPSSDTIDWNAGIGQRQLGGGGVIVWKINALDRLLFKSFLLLCISASAVMIFAIGVGYSMPIGLSVFQVSASRFGAVIVSMTTIIVPFHLKSLETPCFLRYEGDDLGDDSSNPDGISSMKGLVLISMIILGSFFVALGSVDPNRETTYAKLEEEAHYNKIKRHLNVINSKKSNEADNMLSKLNLTKSLFGTGDSQSLDQNDKQGVEASPGHSFGETLESCFTDTPKSKEDTDM